MTPVRRATKPKRRKAALPWKRAGAVEETPGRGSKVEVSSGALLQGSPEQGQDDG